MLDLGVESAKRLNGIEAKEHSPLMKQLTDGIHLDPITGQEMTGCQRDKAGFGRERAVDEIWRDFTSNRWLKKTSGRRIWIWKQQVRYTISTPRRARAGGSHQQILFPLSI